MAKMDKGVLTGKPVTYQIPSPAGEVQMETFIPWTLVKRGVRREIITPLDAPQACWRRPKIDQFLRVVPDEN